MTSVDDAYANFDALSKSVQTFDLSAHNFINDIGAKTLVIAAAGDLERRLCSTILELYRGKSLSEHLVQFVDKQALERKFHTLFNWDSNNVNTFLGLFGTTKKAELKTILENDPYRSQVIDFMYIGRTRNNIVHKGLTIASIENTKEEVYQKYRSGLAFVNFVALNL